MDVTEAIKTRKSVRNYLDKEVSDDTLKELFVLVRLSPSSRNVQPWDFIVVRDAEKRKLLSEFSKNQKHIVEAPAVVILLGSTDPLAYADEIGFDDDKRRRLGFVAEWPREKRVAMAHQNVNLAAMTLMLAAHSMGLGTCCIGAFDQEKVRGEFNVPENFEIVMLMTLGYEKQVDGIKPHPRRSVESVLHFEKL